MGTKRELYARAKDVQFDRDSSELSSCRSCFEDEDSYEATGSKYEDELDELKEGKKMEIESDDEEEIKEVITKKVKRT